jgi:hypothetical protein
MPLMAGQLGIARVHVSESRRIGRFLGFCQPETGLSAGHGEATTYSS